jgi:hypothetical protein
MSENEKQLQDLLIAVVKMEKNQEVTVKSQETTTTNINKLVDNMQLLLPVHSEISNIKKALYGTITLTIMYAAWITIEYHRIDTALKTHIAIQQEKEEKEEKENKEMSEKISNNKEQIGYVKGAKLDKPKRIGQ